MSTEFIGFKERFKQPELSHLGMIPLLQWNKLSKAEQIADINKLTNDDIFLAWNFARFYTLSRNYVALAFTQIDPDLQLEYAKRNDLRNIIYFGDYPLMDISLRDRIIINPSAIITSKYFFIREEACGSIEDAKVRQVVKRPMTLTLSGFSAGANLKKLEYFERHLAGESASVALHEIKHLEGKSVLDEPENILDFVKPGPEWQDCDVSQQVVFNTISFQNNFCEWMVFRDRKIIVVDQFGKYKYDYAKPGK